MKNENCAGYDDNSILIYEIMDTELTRNLQFLVQVVKADHVLGFARKTAGNKTEHHYPIM